MSFLKAGSSIFIIFMTLIHPLTMIMCMPMQQQQQQQQVKDIKRASSSSSSSSSYEELISKTCKQTYYFNVCMATLLKSNFTTTTHKATIHDLAVISINATAAYATNTSAIIAAILKGSTGSSQQSLSDCLEQYGDAVDELQESMAELESCDYETVNVKVSAAMTNSDTCEDGFQDEGVSSPLTERNEFFFKLCSNSLAIVKLLA